jgi:hypothetical protein
MKNQPAPKKNFIDKGAKTSIIRKFSSIDKYSQTKGAEKDVANGVSMVSSIFVDTSLTWAAKCIRTESQENTNI